MKYKKENAIEISEGKRILYEDNNLKIKKNKSDLILFRLEEKIKFLGNKR